MLSTDWGNFFVAVAGAAGALTGLIFVGISISLNRILSIPKLSTRALEPIILLMSVLIIALMGLVPGQNARLFAIETLFIAVVASAITLTLGIQMFRQTDAEYKKLYLRNLLLTQIAILPYIIACVWMLIFGYPCIYILVPGVIISFIKSVLDAWVLLIEIHR